MQWYIKVLTNYAEFKGRAHRTEYWMFVLVSMLVVIVLGIIESILGISSVSEYGSNSGPIVALYNLAVLIPSIAVGVRRLHDTDKSGWWMLLILIPIIGWLLLLYYLVLDSQAESNQFGENPKGVQANSEPAQPPQASQQGGEQSDVPVPPESISDEGEQNKV